MIVSNSHKREGFSANGGKLLCSSDMNFWKGKPKMTDPNGVYFELQDGIEEVEDGFFELLPTLSELEIANSVRKIGMTEKTLEIFRNNNVLIRGVFDSYAETFAKEHGLRFLHSDFCLALDGDYSSLCGIDEITLRFTSDAQPYIRQENFCSGSSTGNNGGGHIDIQLPKNFHLTHSQKDIANLCWGNCREKIESSFAIGTFLEKARKLDGYFL